MSVKRKSFSALALCVALIVLIVVSGVLDRQKTWVDMPYTLLSFENGRMLSTERGDDYGVMNAGPGLDLPAGEYRLKWIIAADGDNVIRITSENGAKITPVRLQLSAEKPALEAYFTIEEAAQGVGFEVSFEDGTRIDVQVDSRNRCY